MSGVIDTFMNYVKKSTKEEEFLVENVFNLILDLVRV